MNRSFPRIPRPGFYPFWFWNGMQNEPEITAQLKEFADSGCRGAVLHARKGNQIPYLSDRWIELVEFACEEARKLNLKIWIYDEEGYPSGNAGMRIQKEHPELIQKCLHFAYSATDPASPAYAAFSLPDYRLLDETVVPAGTPALRFTIAEVPRHVDTLRPETVKHFIGLTHEAYAKRLFRFFGNTVEAVYTDDESFLVWNENAPVWSEELVRVLEEKTGRDFRRLLPALIADLPESAEIRRLYSLTAQELFIRNFIRPQSDWCRAHDLLYLGHLCGDEGPRVRSIKNFAFPELYYCSEDVPSLDDYLLDMKDLGYLRRPYTGDAFRLLPCGLERCYPLNAYKTASSVANRSGVRQVSSENWTYLGWNMPPEFLEPQTLFEIAMSQTLLTPHAFYFTLDGEAEQDCPPSYFIQQPFWPMLKKKIPVWTRLAERFAATKSTAETLVIVPAALLEYQNGDSLTGKPDAALNAMDLALQNLILELMRRHVEFDVMDEPLLANTRRDGARLIAGEMSYTTVIYPSVLPLQPESMTLLRGMELRTEKELDGVRSLWPLANAEELLTVFRKEEDGSDLVYLQNLSGRELSLSGAFPFGVQTLYDPLRECGIFTGDAFPQDFVMPAGRVLLLQTHEAEKRLPFADSEFRKVAAPVRPVRITSWPIGVSSLGDMVPQGFSGKAGIFEYRAEFEGRGRLLTLRMTGGVAEVAVNDGEPEVVWGGGTLPLAGKCTEGTNRLLIRFANTAGNLYGDKNAPFGLDSVTVE